LLIIFYINFVNFVQQKQKQQQEVEQARIRSQQKVSKTVGPEKKPLIITELAIEVCGSTISTTRPVPVADDATGTRTRPAPKISTQNLFFQLSTSGYGLRGHSLKLAVSRCHHITSHHMVKTDAGLNGLYIREINIYIRLYY